MTQGSLNYHHIRVNGFLLKVMVTFGRIRKGRLVPLSMPVRFLISGKSDGEPSAFQAVEERILTEAPSSMMVPTMTIL